MVGDILPLLSLEKRNQRVKASGAPWEYPKEIANEARPVLSSERGSGEPQEQPCSVGWPESTVAFFRVLGAAAHRHRAGRSLPVPLQPPHFLMSLVTSS